MHKRFLHKIGGIYGTKLIEVLEETRMEKLQGWKMATILLKSSQ